MYSFQLCYYYSCAHIYTIVLRRYYCLVYFYLIVKSGRSFVKIGSRLQIASPFIFISSKSPPPTPPPGPPTSPAYQNSLFIRDPRVNYVIPVLMVNKMAQNIFMP